MTKTVARTVYFDNAATTPILPCALERLNELSAAVFGNSSSSHRKGRQAEDVLNQCHEALGLLFNVPPSHVVFTSGGTESNNLAIWGALGGLTQAFHWIKTHGQGKLLTSTIEHPATSRVFDALQEMGAPVRWIEVDGEGLLKLEQLSSELSERTRLLSFHHVQNEVGVLQDIAAVSRLVRAKQPDALIHIDAVQSFMKVRLDLGELGVDMVSISGHKFGGPKGVGALILGRRFEKRSPKIGPLLYGSPQQHGFRPGTVPVPAIGALVSAIEWNSKHLADNTRTLLALRERLTSRLPSRALINGPADVSAASPRRAPQTINFSLPGLPSAIALEALSSLGYCVSAGSACNSTNPKPNETLKGMGADPIRALSAMRISLSPQNTLEEVDGFVSALGDVIKQFS